MMSDALPVGMLIYDALGLLADILDRPDAPPELVRAAAMLILLANRLGYPAIGQDANKKAREVLRGGAVEVRVAGVED
jgi:hypothetical protein